MSVAERVFTYENHQGHRFIPNLCPTCPHFIGTRSCNIHLSTVKKDEEILHIHGLNYLDTENPYKQMKECKIKKAHPRVVYHDKRTKQPSKPPGLPSPSEVLKWMKENLPFHNMDKEAYNETENSFKSIMDAIELFYHSDIETLVERHSSLVYNSRSNSFFSEPFNRFTGAGLFTSGIVGKEQMKSIAEELKLLSPHAQILRKGMDVTEKYQKLYPKDHFKSNFTNVIRSLIAPNLKQLAFGINTASWPYIGRFREALIEWTGFTDEQIPKTPECPNGWNKECELKHNEFGKEKEKFLEWAHQQLTH